MNDLDVNAYSAKTPRSEWAFTLLEELVFIAHNRSNQAECDEQTA